jgi:hypothetical protein
MDAMGDDLKGEPVYKLPAESVALSNTVEYSRTIFHVIGLLN